ncbi:MAG: hypothetical protein ABID71_03125 [Chloroflexota bacterium]
MFGKKKQVTTAHVVEGAAAQTARPAKEKIKKVKPLTPQEIMTKQIEQLEGTQVATYKLPPDRGGWMAMVSINPTYPTKGRKFIMTIDRMPGGVAGKEKSVLWDSNSAKDMANWIIDRGGQSAS